MNVCGKCLTLQATTAAANYNIIIIVVMRAVLQGKAGSGLNSHGTYT